jgi:hypothetical protein
MFAIDASLNWLSRDSAWQQKAIDEPENAIVRRANS